MRCVGEKLLVGGEKRHPGQKRRAPPGVARLDSGDAGQTHGGQKFAELVAGDDLEDRVEARTRADHADEVLPVLGIKNAVGVIVGARRVDHAAIL